MDSGAGSASAWLVLRALGDGGGDNGSEAGGVAGFFGAADELVLIAGDDEDGGGVLQVEAEAKVVVCLDPGGEGAAGIEDEGHGLAVLLEEAGEEVLEVFLPGDGCLVGENGGAELFGEAGVDAVLEVAGADGAVKGPDVGGDGEIVAEDGDVVLGGDLELDGVGAGAAGAGKVFKDDDGDLLAGGRLEEGGVLEGAGGDGGEELGVGGGEEEEEGGEAEEARVHGAPGSIRVTLVEMGIECLSGRRQPGGVGWLWLLCFVEGRRLVLTGGCLDVCKVNQVAMWLPRRGSTTG